MGERTKNPGDVEDFEGFHVVEVTVRNSNGVSPVPIRVVQSAIGWLVIQLKD